MTRYQVRDVEALREAMREPRRLVGFSVRTLAQQVGANRTTIGYLLTGERPSIEEDVAKRIAEAFGRDVDDLFAPAEFMSVNEDGDVGEVAP